MLADDSGRSKRFSEDFLREFFSIISERLEAGESVKIKGLGTFRLSRVEPRKSVDVTSGKPMEISGHSKVVFIPAKEIAEGVNAPFEAFTSIEIGDDIDIDQLMSFEKTTEVEPTDEGEFEEEDIMIPAEAENQDSMRVSFRSTPTNFGNPDNLKNEERQDELEDLEEFEEPDNLIKIADPIDYEEPDDLDEIEESEELGETEETSEETQKPTEAISSATTEESAEPRQETESSEKDETSDDSVDFEEEEFQEEVSGKRNWIKGVLICFAAAIVALLATFAVWYIFATNDFNKRFNRESSSMAKGAVDGFTVGKATESPEIEEADNQILLDTAQDEEEGTDEEELKAEFDEVPTAPSDAIVYDTISTTRYLTTMAKKHYGNYNLWPYIYEENKAKLGHPDRIRPGTPVVIPKLSKYGVDPNNAADIEKAKKMGVTIYAKYGKSI